MKFRLLATLAICALASSCAVTVPVAVISQNGDVMRGSATADLKQGSFHVAGKIHGRQTTCDGTYDQWDTSITISMAVHCVDGRKGIVMATRDASGLSGQGRVRLTDGTEADFIFGKAAGKI